MFKSVISTKNPLFIFETRHGTIFNLTPSNLPFLPGVSFSAGDLFDMKQTLMALPVDISIKQFFGFSNQTITYMAPYDFYKEKCMSGSQNSKIVKIKCSKGFIQFTADKYDQLVSIFKPDILVGLTQYPMLEKDHLNESNKSFKRAIIKTTSYLQNTQLEYNTQYKPLRLIAIHGGKNLSLITRSLQHNLQQCDKIDGFIVCDLCQSQTLQQRQQIYNLINLRLKDQKKQYFLGLSGLGKINDIKHAIKYGYCIFEIRYPFLLAEKQLALIQKQNQYIEYKPKLNEQLQPLNQLCKCSTCQRYSQSYIAHLSSCYQMTAKVLLSIHNLQCYLRFINSFQKV